MTSWQRRAKSKVWFTDRSEWYVGASPKWQPPHPGVILRDSGQGHSQWLNPQWSTWPFTWGGQTYIQVRVCRFMALAVDLAGQRKIKDKEVRDRGMWMNYVSGQEVCGCPPESSDMKSSEQWSRMTAVDVSQVLSATFSACRASASTTIEYLMGVWSIDIGSHIMSHDASTWPWIHWPYHSVSSRRCQPEQRKGMACEGTAEVSA